MPTQQQAKLFATHTARQAQAADGGPGGGQCVLWPTQENGPAPGALTLIVPSGCV